MMMFVEIQIFSIAYKFSSDFTTMFKFFGMNAWTKLWKKYHNLGKQMKGISKRWIA